MAKICRSFGVFAVVVAAIIAMPASAAVRVSAFGVGSFADVTSDDDSRGDFGSEFGLGAGVGFEMPLAPTLGIELGVVYDNRKTSGSFAGVNGSATYPYIQIPVMLRFWLADFVTLGIGGYYAFEAGDGTLEASAGGISGSAGFDSPFSSSDFGLIAAAGLNFPLAPTLGIMVEGRYNWGLANIADDGGGDASWRELQALAGLRFSL